MDYDINPLTDSRFTKSGIKKLAFDYGIKTKELELATYLKQYAWKNDESGVAKTFIAISDSDILGYYSLSSSVVEFPESIKSELKLPSYPIPVALIGKLAVQKKYQKHEIGRGLIKDAYLKILEASKLIGIFAVALDAIDDQVKQIYVDKFGFSPLADTLTVFLPIETLRAAMSPTSKQ